LSSGRAKIGGRHQLQWVVLLLGIAVVLPTVCLLWFMSQAVRNERLVVRQKLIEVYTEQLGDITAKIERKWAEQLELLDRLGRMNRAPIETFGIVSGQEQRGDEGESCCSIVIYDANGRLLYPIPAAEDGYSQKLPDTFNQAWEIEYVEGNYARAEAYYRGIAEKNPGGYPVALARMGQVRCLRKAGQIDRAVKLCSKLAYADTSARPDSASISLTTQARVLLVELEKESQAGVKRADLQRLVNSAIDYTPKEDSDFLPMSSDSRQFLLGKALEFLQTGQWAEQFEPEISRATELLAAEQLASSTVEQLGGSGTSRTLSAEDVHALVSSFGSILEAIQDSNWPAKLGVDTSMAKRLVEAAQKADSSMQRKSGGVSFASRSNDTLFRIIPSKDVFAMYHRTGGYVYLLLQKAESVRSALGPLAEKLSGLGLSCRVVDETGRYVAGLEHQGRPVLFSAGLGRFFPGWRVELYSGEAGIFEKAASRRIAIYTWTGALVIVLILGAGGIAANTVTRQIRLNRLKNNFLATVSHELKTPLASMRILVDTLLEGNIRDRRQADEYLHLTAKENERLSRMIDNFLTFSRMERNKKAFEIADCNPADIAADAVEAVRTKFSTAGCRFDVQIDDNLPDVPADHDAMVTVVVNLLDNACKYTYDDKRISLSVYSEGGYVCFSISDNGVGLTRRQTKKIFARFYQADSSLSRRSEGCGLGLSIVKFIVDAHKGKISVQSKPGKGSSFTVKLAAGIGKAD